MTDLPDVTTALARIDPGVSADVVIDAIGKVELLERAAREARKLLDAAAIEWIDRNGAIEVGTVRWYVGVRKDKRSRDNVATLDRLYVKAGGDVARVADALASQPFRTGQARELLGEVEFGEHFETVEVKELREGKTARRLLKTDTQYVTR